MVHRAGAFYRPSVYGYIVSRFAVNVNRQFKIYRIFYRIFSRGDFRGGVPSSPSGVPGCFRIAPGAGDIQG
nr:MAG TPA: hypothetical protein [Caudoviricetes sp.]